MPDAPTSHPLILAVHGDITLEDVEAIVNATDEHLVAGGGGVDRAIHVAAGDTELRAALAELGGCEIGDAKVTPGFALAAKYIIHTVGPVWSGGHKDEANLLASCYRRCLEVADEIGVRSLAIPAIATGAFGLPAELAARIAIDTIRATPTSVRLIRLVASDVSTRTLYDRALRGS
jgi:O-acetyl-ADP-ribose deacetylase